MDDEEILNTVESLFGKDVKIVDCEKTSTVQQEEVLLINGVQVKLDSMSNDDAAAIKNALLDGQMPSVEQLNQLLFQAGLAQQPIQVETSLTVKSSLITTEEVLVSRNGLVLDEQSCQTKEDFNHQSHKKEIWQPKQQQARLFKPAQKQLCKSPKESKHQTDFILNSNNTSANNMASFSMSSNGLTNTLSNASTAASDISSSSAITGSDQIISSNSSILTGTTIGDYSAKCSNVSYDSGHDGLFHSLSITATSPHNKKDCHADSSYYDIPSSADEAESFQTFNLNSKKQIHSDSNATKNQALIYANGKLISGTLDALLNLIVEQSHRGNDPDIEYTILLCVRQFAPPHELLTRICRIWLEPLVKSENLSNNYLHLQSPQHLIELLNRWLEICPNDFRNDKFMRETRTITEKCLSIDHELHASITVLQQSISKKLSVLDIRRKEIEQFSDTNVKHAESTPNGLVKQSSFCSFARFSSSANKSDCLLNVCNTAFLFAQQLTVIEQTYLLHITPEEYLQLLTMEDIQHKVNNSLQSHKVNLSQWNCASSITNVAAYVNWFNRLSYFTATEIVKLTKKSQRVQMMDYFIEAALECFNIGNFNSLMAILTGLNQPAVARLKKTWTKMKYDKFTGLEHQMDPSSNFRSYRSTMKAAIWRSERENSNKQEVVIIPFFTLFLKDLYSLNERSPTKLCDNHINFEKCTQFATQIQNFLKWKDACCPYDKLPKVIAYFQNAEVYTDEDSLMRASFACEPPDGVKEKEHHKSLKAETKMSNVTST